MVMGVPDSALPAAEGYARRSGIPYGQGLVKNRYIGRTFIVPNQAERAQRRAAQAQPAPGHHRGPAAGRGRRLHRAGHHHPGHGRACCARPAPAEVHLRISSPPYRWPCYYGLDTGTRAELIAANLEVGEIRDYLGADSLAYLEL